MYEEFKSRFHAFEVKVHGDGFKCACWARMAKYLMIPSDDLVDKGGWDAYFLLVKDEGLAINVELFISIRIEESLKCGVVILVLCYDGIIDGTNIVIIVVSNVDIV